MSTLRDSLYRRLHRAYFLSLFPEEGPARCAHEGCPRFAARSKTLCARHQYEAVKKRPCPWKEDYSDAPIEPSKKPDGEKTCAMCGRRKTFGANWIKENPELLCNICWPQLDSTVEWYEQRLELLESCIGRVFRSKPDLFRLLGKEQSHVRVDDGEWLTGQVIDHLSLPRGKITFQFTKMDQKVAGSVETTGSGYAVKMSKDLEDNFRAVSAIIIHELMHIYLNSNGIFYKTQEEYEEATDLACVLLGFGIPMVNAKRAWHVERTALGGRGVESGTKYYSIGYLSDLEIGYSLARFLADRAINPDELRDAIDDDCWQIVEDCVFFERKFRDKVLARAKASIFLSERQSTIAFHKFSCPVCFQKLRARKETILRIGILKTKCPKCHSVIHFDGTNVVKFIESLR